MRKVLRLTGYVYQDIADLMTMMYQLKGEEMTNNEEIAQEIQDAIDKVDIARNNIFEARQILQMIYNECYED